MKKQEYTNEISNRALTLASVIMLQEVPSSPNAETKEYKELLDCITKLNDLALGKTKFRIRRTKKEIAEANKEI